MSRLKEIIEQNRKARGEMNQKHSRLSDALMSNSENLKEVVNEILEFDEREIHQLHGEERAVGTMGGDDSRSRS